MAHRARLIGGLVVGVALVVGVVPTWRGAVRVGAVDVPMPAPALRIAERSWIVAGRRDIAGYLREAGPRAGWRAGEQLGSMLVIERPSAALAITWRITGSIFTRVDVGVRQ